MRPTQFLAEKTDERGAGPARNDSEPVCCKQAPSLTQPHDAQPQSPTRTHEPLTEAEDTTSDWAVISEATTQYDEQTLADWRDDLANLLVFSGLFSSVVTAFTVESYTWLQQSGAPDPFLQVQLLSQISAQLNSLSISPGFVNSTVQSIPPSGLQATIPSSQVHLNIRINTLWFLSLALSLVSSLLAIMVQQWLRAYRLPGHLTIRERVRLREYRYTGLRNWGVPQIVSTLSVLLQIALILFLSGLCYLLASLDRTVAKTFIAFVGVALAIYSSFVILPIAFRHCPYKNSLAHAITWTAQILVLPCWIGIYITLGSLLLAFGGMMILAGLAKEMIMGGLRLDFRDEVIQKYMALTRWMSKMFKFIYDPLIDFAGRDYWVAKELNVLPTLDKLDSDALIWAPTAVSQANLSRIARCLRDLPPRDHERCVMAWAAQTLNIDVWSLDDGVRAGISPFDLQTLSKIDRTFAERFQEMMLSVLPEEFKEPSTRNLLTYSFYPPCLLVMLRHIARTKAVSTDFITGYTQRVMSIRGNQPTSQLEGRLAWSRLPTSCLFECSTILRYQFTHEEISRLFDYTDQIRQALFPLDDHTMIFVTHLEPILVSTATALHAFSRRSLNNNSDELELELRAKCRALLVKLDQVLVAEKGRIRLLSTYRVDWASDGVWLCAVPAIATICESIVALTEAEVLPTLLDGDSEVADVSFLQLVDHIIDTLRDEYAYTEAVALLVGYRDTHSSLVGDVAELGSLDYRDVTPGAADSIGLKVAIEQDGTALVVGNSGTPTFALP